MKFSGLAVVFLAMLLVACPSMAAITCNDVVSDLTPCLSYLTSGSGQPTPACCTGASKVAAAVSTVDDAKALCTCLVSAAQNIQPKMEAVKALPGSCGISVSISLTPNVDCSKIG